MTGLGAVALGVGTWAGLRAMSLFEDARPDCGQMLDAAGDDVTVGAPQSMQVKGREEPIDVFPFIGMKDEVRP